jgi:hypothetical protein
MATRTYKFDFPLSKTESFDLLLQAGERLPESSELAGVKFGRWENTDADRENGRLEWVMYDHKFASIRIGVALDAVAPQETKATFEIMRAGQLLDPLGLYKKTLHLIIDPFIELAKQKGA